MRRYQTTHNQKGRQVRPHALRAQTATGRLMVLTVSEQIRLIGMRNLLSWDIGLGHSYLP